MMVFDRILTQCRACRRLVRKRAGSPLYSLRHFPVKNYYRRGTPGMCEKCDYAIGKMGDYDDN